MENLYMVSLEKYILNWRVYLFGRYILSLNYSNVISFRILFWEFKYMRSWNFVFMVIYIKIMGSSDPTLFMYEIDDLVYVLRMTCLTGMIHIYNDWEFLCVCCLIIVLYAALVYLLWLVCGLAFVCICIVSSYLVS